MSLTSRLTACLAALALAAGLSVVAAPALASHGQTVYFEAPNDLLSAKGRPGALAKLQSLGVHALRIVLYWQDVAPGAHSSRQPRFDPTSPAGYAWGQYDALITAAVQRRWPVLLTVSGPVPRWATVSRRDNVTHPDPLAFQRFMTAVGRHYGTQVSLFSIWNEPNHPFFLLPQFNANGTPASPRLYRALFQAGYAGLQAGGLKAPRVLMGDTAPTGYTTAKGKHDVAPLTFLRGALCLNSRYQKASSCAALPAVGYAHHAYTIPAGPYYAPPERDDVTIGTLSRLSRALDLAARARALTRPLPIYLTEFGWQSKPNRFLGVSLPRQAQFNAISERIAYDNPRVAAFSQYLLRDDPQGGRPGSGVRGGYVGFQTGLELLSGRPKPSYNGFRLPLTVTPSGHRFSLWGLVRPAGAASRVQVLVLDSRARRYRAIASAVTDGSGYWRATVADARAQQFQVRWRAPGGTLYTGATIAPYHR